VHAGDLLAQIDPRPYQALIDQYTGNLERDQAQLINAQANLTRYTTLGDKGWATPQLLETQKAQVGQLQAAIKADQALIDAAKVQLSFTRLTSPIDGVAGIRQIDVGNIISPSSTNGLVVVTQIDPISLIFTLPGDGSAANSASAANDQGPARGPRLQPGRLRPCSIKAYSALSTTRSCRPRARSSSRRTLPTNRAGSGLANSSTRGCSSTQGTTASPSRHRLCSGSEWRLPSTSSILTAPSRAGRSRSHRSSKRPGASLISGLKANEQVVVDGQYKLQPGTRVTMLHGAAAQEAIAQSALQAAHPMNISAPFIRRPIATALLMVGLLVGGLVSYPLLPVAALPNVNYPTLQITAQLPGADPQTMASSVATPLELQFGEIPGLAQMTSASAARLHPDHPPVRSEPPNRRDGERCAVGDQRLRPPVFAGGHAVSADDPEGQSGRHPDSVLGLTSDTLPLTTVDAYAENILLQKISQISGVGLVGVGGQRSPPFACSSTRRLSQPAASTSRTSGRRSARPMSIWRKVHSTARARPTRSHQRSAAEGRWTTPIW